MVTSSFLPGRGGIESYLAEMADELAPRVAVLAAARREGRALPDDLPYPTVPFAGRLLVPGRRARDATLSAARRLGTDRVLFGTPWPLVLMGPRLRAEGVSYAVIVHGAEMLVPAALPAVRGRLAVALAEADLILAVSDFTAGKVRELLAAHGHGDRAVPVLRARVDLDRFQPSADGTAVRERHGIRPEAKVILSLGRLVRRKGVHRLIAALPEIRAAAGDVVLLVAGTGPESSRLRRVAARTRSPVIFAGRVSDDDAPSYYAAADVFALPVVDRYRGLDVEGLGVVLLEAAATGLPAVTGRSGGTPEAVLDGRTGSVVDASDKSQLVGALVRILTDGDLARAMGEAGRSYVGAEFARRDLPDELMRWLGSRRSI